VSVDIAGIIDHSLLRPDATEADIERLCAEAIRYGFHSVCVNPFFIRRARNSLAGSGVRTTAVIGFPLGMTLTGVKVYEALQASNLGAEELDFVINIGAAKAAHWDIVRRDISDVVAATGGLTRKAIIEACYLDDDEKMRAVEAALQAGVEFIKTSTGFAPGGATVHDVRLIRGVVDGRAGVKAAGGIRSLADLKALVEAGATRIGTSRGPQIMAEAAGRTA
jgi:deoxyribose-phosphate aldolase